VPAAADRHHRSLPARAGGGRASGDPPLSAASASQEDDHTISRARSEAHATPYPKKPRRLGRSRGTPARTSTRGTTPLIRRLRRPAALVALDVDRDGLCLPPSTSSACFVRPPCSATDERPWKLAPSTGSTGGAAYCRHLVLATTFHTATWSVRVLDIMPVPRGPPDVERIVRGRGWEVANAMDLVVRSTTVHTVPWVRRIDGRCRFVGRPGRPRAAHAGGLRARRRPGESSSSLSRRATACPFVLTCNPSCRPSGGG
jgi:hypothetical protein